MIRIIAFLTALVLGASSVGAIEARLVWMGTGSVAGVYFPVGVSLCRLVNQTRREHGIRCAARVTEGSVGNLAGLRGGGLDLALAQSDSQADAWRGTGDFADDGPDTALRSVMSLHAEPLTIVTRKGSGIAALSDLPGKRISVGSGQRALMGKLMAGLGWTETSFAAVEEVPPEDLDTALCGGSIDAFVLAIGHPALVVQEVTGLCDAVLVPVTGPAVEAVIASDPAYFATVIPGGLYRGIPADVPTFGVGATVVTRADVPEEVVYTVTRAIFQDFDTLVGLNPALGTLDRDQMIRRGLTAPLHPGAERYYREQGWLP